MLLHVVPMSECLLFVSYSYDNNRKFTYGSPNGCYAAGVLPLVVAVGAIGLMFVQVMMMMMMMMMMIMMITMSLLPGNIPSGYPPRYPGPCQLLQRKVQDFKTFY